MTRLVQGWELFTATGNGVSGASVTIYVASATHPNPNSSEATTTTGSDGFWSASGLAEGPKDVKVTYLSKVKWYKGLSLGGQTVPAARAYHSANQSINSGTNTTLNFDSERFDSDTIHDNVTNNSRLTCKTAGKYLICCNVRWASNATG